MVDDNESRIGSLTREWEGVNVVGCLNVTG